MNPSNGTCLYWNKFQESKLKTWLVWIVTKVQLYTQYKQCTVSQNIGKTTLLYRVLQKDSIPWSKLITPERGIMSTIKIKKNRGSLQHPVMQCCLLTLETCFSIDKCSDNAPLQVVPRFSLSRVTFSTFAKFSASLIPLLFCLFLTTTHRLEWSFMLASVERPIIGADFLCHYQLDVSLACHFSSHWMVRWGKPLSPLENGILGSKIDFFLAQRDRTGPGPTLTGHLWKKSTNIYSPIPRPHLWSVLS